MIYRLIHIKGDGISYQVVVPGSLTAAFIQYYHDNPLGGHLGRLKTLMRILIIA